LIAWNSGNPEWNGVKDMIYTGAQIVIKLLENQGVKVIAGIPGSSNLPIYDELSRSSIKHILSRHEQGAGFIAQGIARTTGDVAVAFATSGPGATNIITAIADAKLDSIPVVFITGQVATSMIGTDAFQEVDITGITMPISKHNYLVKDAKKLPSIIKNAFYIASTGRPGPVLVDLPKDVASELIKFDYPKTVNLRGYKPISGGHKAKVKEAAELMMKAKRPVIYAGGGIISSHATEELRELAEILTAPVTNTFMGLSSFPGDHPLFLGMLGLHGTRHANMAVTNCDLLISLGARFGDRVTGKLDSFAPNATIIHVDIDPAEHNKNRASDIAIVASITSLP